MAEIRVDERGDSPSGKAGHRSKRGGGRDKSRVRPGKKREWTAGPVKLVIAFNQPDLERAISVAADVAGFTDWICVGSTLIKSEGMRAVRAIATGFPELEIFLDLRAAVGAAREAGLAFEAGADLASVSCLASEKACREVVGVAKTFGGKAVYDLYGATDPVIQTQRALELGFDYLYFSAEGGISGEYEAYRRVAESAKLPLIVDGEIEFREFARVSKLLPAAIVVGKRITESGDPRSAAGRFGELIHRRRAA